MYRGGFLIRSYRNAPSNINGFSSDYSFLITALLDLYEGSSNIDYLKFAIELQERMDQLFYDNISGGYFHIDGRDNSLIIKMKDDYDGAEPSENSYTLMNLSRLYNITENNLYKEKAIKTSKFFYNDIANKPFAVPHMAAALTHWLSPSQTVVIAGDPTTPNAKEMIRLILGTYDSFRSIIYAEGKEGQSYLRALNVPYITDENMTLGGKPVVYICKNFNCLPPTNDIETIKSQLENK